MIRHLATAFTVTLVAALGVAAPAQAEIATAGAVQTPERVTFGKIPLGTTVVQQFTVTNTGSEPLVHDAQTYLQVRGTGGFTAVEFTLGDCPEIGSALAPGDSCTWAVELTAGVSGTVAGEVCFLGRSGGTAVDLCSRYAGVIAKPRG